MNKEATIIELPSSFMSVMAIILVVYSGRTIARNPDWHDYLHLYETDVEHLENSAKAHALISNILYPRIQYQIKQNPQNPEIKKNIDKIIHHYHEAIRIDSTYITSLNNLGSAYIDLAKQPAKGLPYCMKALELKPNYQEATINIATAYARMNQPDSALKYFIRTIEIDPENLNVYNALNPFLNRNNIIDKGIVEMDRVARKSLKPKFIYTNLANLTSLDESKMQTTIAYFEKAFEYDKTDKKLCNHLVMLHNRFGDKEKVKYYAQFCN